MTRSSALQVHRADAAPLVVLEIVADALLAIERAHAGSFNRADVNERITASVLRLNEAIALVLVEELHGSGDHFGYFLLWRTANRPPFARRGGRRKRGRKAP